MHKTKKYKNIAKEFEDARSVKIMDYDWCGICVNESLCESYCGLHNFKRGIISSFIRKIKEKFFRLLDRF